MTANCHRDSFGFTKLKKDEAEYKTNVKFSMSSIKEAMSISKANLVWITGKRKMKEKRSTPFMNITKRFPMPKELQENKYPFLDSYLSGMLDVLLKKVSFNFQNQTDL